MSTNINPIDDIDRKIIRILSENSRISLVQLSEEIGLSRVAAKARVSNLEKSGVIEKYTLILNPEQMGHAITISLDLEIDPNHLKEVCDTLKNSPYIHKLYQMTGKGSLHGHAMLPDNKTLETFLQDTVYNLPGLISVDCNTIIARLKDNSEIRV